MKVAQIFGGELGLKGGVPKVVYLLSKGLSTRGHKIDVIVSESSELSKNIKIIKFKKYFEGITPGLFFYLIKNKYDIIHVHGYNTFQPFICTLAKIFKKCPLVFTPYYHPIGKHPVLLRRAFDLTFGKFAFKMSDKVTIISPIEKKQLSKFKIQNSKIELIPCPIDEIFFSKINDTNFKKKWNLKSKVILFVGRLDDNKGLEVLIKSFKIVKQKCDSISLLIVGKDVNMLVKLKKLVLDIQLDDIIFTGLLSQEDLLKAYACADVFVLPSSYEAFGLTIIEAIAQGVPVIATNVGSIPYVLKNGKCGKIIEYGNVGELATAIIELLDDEQKRLNYIGQGYRRIRDFSLSDVSEKLENVYKEMLYE